jgi:hypothetical protein
MLSMKYLLMGVYQVCSNKSPRVKIGPAGGGEERREKGGRLLFLYLFICV